MLIDDITIRVKAGDGGDGLAVFNKNLMQLGPAGGDGGIGGNVYFQGTSDLNALGQFRHVKELKAGDGRRGRGQMNDGPDGEDLICLVPVGTVVHNLTTGTDTEVVTTKEPVLIAKGGRPGKGNFKFRSSTNTSPRKFTTGKPGEDFQLRLELKLIADVGFVGLPNAGKSSLLNELTGAHSKVANYPFTTLEPSLGVYYELILADIPGLIEGASTGKGLGVKFLRHVERTNTIFHLVSSESEHPAADYKTIRNELALHSKVLAEKPEYLFLSKTDMISAVEVKKKLAILKKLNKNAVALSIHDSESLEKVKKILNKIKDEK